MKLHCLLAIAALATACDPCHSWDEVKIVDRADRDDTEAVAIIADALVTFAAWTGRETTCVDKVKVVEKLEINGRKVSGQYSSSSSNISIRYRKNERYLGDVTLHELCHAVDHEEGYPSLDHAEALEPYTKGLNDELYETADGRTLEAFANICEEGPQLHPLWRQVEDYCGDDILDPAYRAVHELMFTAGDYSVDLGRFDGSYDSWELAGITPEEDAYSGLWSGPPVTGADGLFMLDTLYTLGDEGLFESVQPVLRHLDPHSATVLETLFLEPFDEVLEDATGAPSFLSHALLGSTTQPILYDRYDPGSAWRVLSDPLELEAVSLPSLVEGARFEGFERDGQLIASIDEGEGPYQATMALEDSAWTPLTHEGLPLEGAYVEAFNAGEDGALVVFSGDSGYELASLSIQGELEWSTPMGFEGGVSQTYGAHRMPDGSVVSPLVLNVDGNRLQTFPLRYDPVADKFSAPTGGCHTLSYYLDGVTWEGGYWMVNRAYEDDSYGPLTLMRLEITTEDQ